MEKKQGPYVLEFRRQMNELIHVRRTPEELAKASRRRVAEADR